jgi:hypothetical protein
VYILILESRINKTTIEYSLDKEYLQKRAKECRVYYKKNGFKGFSFSVLKVWQ